MAQQAVLVPDHHDDRRSSERQEINQPSTLRDEAACACDVYVRDLSTNGCSIETDARLTIGSLVTIGLPGQGRAGARVVREVKDGYGCEFTSPLSPAALAQTFRGETVVRLTSSVPFILPLPDVETERWSGAVRVGLIVGSSLLLWGAIGGVVLALL